MTVIVDIFDDSISELQEVFFLYLRDITGTPTEGGNSRVKAGQDVSIVHITEPGRR